MSTAQKLRAFKQYVLDAVELWNDNPASETTGAAESEPPAAPPEHDPLSTTLAGEVDTGMLSEREFQLHKNETFLKIAKMQAWGAPLEDAWETIEDIDRKSMRDEAIVAVVEMMIVSQDLDDARAWADEIADPAVKRKVLEKVK